MKTPLIPASGDGVEVRVGALRAQVLRHAAADFVQDALRRTDALSTQGPILDVEIRRASARSPRVSSANHDAAR